MRALIVCIILAYANAAPSHLVPLSPLAVRTFDYTATIPTISFGDIQAAAINTHVKYADLVQAAVDKARQMSEQTVEDLNVKAYTNIAANQEQVNEAFWATEDKKLQTLDAIKTAEAQLDGVLASGAPVLVKGAAVGPYVAAVAPYFALPTISPGDIQAAAIDAYVAYTDKAQEAVDKARQISETAQAHLDDALTNNIQASTSSALLSPYLPAVASINPEAYSGFLASTIKSISNNFLLQAQPATSKAITSENTTEDSVKAADDSTKTNGIGMQSVDASVISAESKKSDNEKLMKTAEGSINSTESKKSELDKSMNMAEASINYAKSEKSDIEKSIKTAETSMISPESERSEIDRSMKMAEGSINSAESEKFEIEKSMKTTKASINSAESEKSEVDKSRKTAEASMNFPESEISEIDKSMKMAEGSINSAESEKSEIDKSMKTAEVSMHSVDFEKSAIEKSVKVAEVAFEAAKYKADKAFASLQSPIVSQTVGSTDAYLIPNVYASVGLGQQILGPLQPNAPVVGQIYLKTLY